MVLDPPSQQTYNLTSNNLTTIYYSSDKLYNKYLRKFFSHTKSGFFVEAGALDGETMSNTIWLEKEQGWGGLLVEPDKGRYNFLRFKKRKSWSANCCLSVDKYPKLETFSYETYKFPTMINNTMMWMQMKGMSHIKGAFNLSGIFNHDENYKIESYKIPCYPLASLLLALKVTKVDLLSLDVENTEEKILKSFNFDEFDIEVIFLEWNDSKKAHWMLSFLNQRRYIYVDSVKDDYVFIKSGSRYEQIIGHKNDPYVVNSKQKP